MSNKSLNKIRSMPKYLISAYTIMLLTACADSNIVTLEQSVEQTNDLIDYDRDGVIKARDKCDFTTIGASIDNYGCGTQTSTLNPFKIDIKFEQNSFIIPSVAYVEIKKLVGFLKKNPDLNLVIEGHTSKVGSVELNQTLSENRAKAVALVLENDFGIKKGRISSIGYGFERLKEKGDTEEAHAANRRIIAELSQTIHLDELKWTIYTVDKTD
jgi:outer membrane protein OmpA-like peptidoglycan-associated protein